MFPYGQPGIQRRFVSAPNLAGIMQGHPHIQHQQPYDNHFRLQAGPTTPERTVMFAPDVLHSESFHSANSGAPPSSFLVPPSHATSMPPQAALRPRLVGDPPPSSMLQVHHSHSAPDLLAFQLEQTMHISNLPPSSAMQPDVSPQRVEAAPLRPPEGFVPQTPVLTAPGCFIAQALVPEQMVGSVLGRQGSALNELQMLSGTRIRVSQRGEYMPGTRSRIVTIRGPSAQGVWQAQQMMSQRMVLPTTATAAHVHVSAPQQQPPPPTASRYVSSYEDTNISGEPMTPPKDIHHHQDVNHQVGSTTDLTQHGALAGPSDPSLTQP